MKHMFFLFFLGGVLCVFWWTSLRDVEWFTTRVMMRIPIFWVFGGEVLVRTFFGFMGGEVGWLRFW